METEPAVRRTCLNTIAQNLSHFARRCIEAGADGIFLSVREDWVDQNDGVYQRLVRPADLRILARASAGRFNMLHVCGRPLDLRHFDDYPVHVIKWANRAAGPKIADVNDWIKPAICAGVDNLSTMPNGSPADVTREVTDAPKQAAGRPIMISPGCTFDPAKVPPANLKAFGAAVSGVVASSDHATAPTVKNHSARFWHVRRQAEHRQRLPQMSARGRSAANGWPTRPDRKS